MMVKEPDNGDILKFPRLRLNKKPRIFKVLYFSTGKTVEDKKLSERS